jgi:hypothetical protein
MLTPSGAVKKSGKRVNTLQQKPSPLSLINSTNRLLGGFQQSLGQGQDHHPTCLINLHNALDKRHHEFDPRTMISDDKSVVPSCIDHLLQYPDAPTAIVFDRHPYEFVVVKLFPAQRREQALIHFDLGAVELLRTISIDDSIKAENEELACPSAPEHFEETRAIASLHPNLVHSQQRF